ncbi:MAG: hypothetical protein ACLU4N_00960 [Butyricimonas faecihominis]
MTGYALCNSRLSGPWLRLIRLQHLAFVILENTLTLPLGSVQKVDQTVADCDLSPKYMNEEMNLFNDQCYVIIKGG